jgi:hypothetical protein
MTRPTFSAMAMSKKTFGFFVVDLLDDGNVD